ncbi:MAG: hypothetical protein R3F65_01370 [bacterium]
MTALWWIVGAFTLLWVLARRRLFELWDDVQAARRQIELQAARRAALTPRLAGAQGAAAASMAADLADIEARQAAAEAILALERVRYRKLAPGWIAWLVRAPSPRRLPDAAEAAARGAAIGASTAPPAVTHAPSEWT